MSQSIFVNPTGKLTTNNRMYWHNQTEPAFEGLVSTVMIIVDQENKQSLNDDTIVLESFHITNKVCADILFEWRKLILSGYNYKMICNSDMYEKLKAHVESIGYRTI